MAETILTHRFQKITVSGTTEHTLNFDNVLRYNTGTFAPKGSNAAAQGMAILELQSGASVQISNDIAIDSASAAIITANPKTMLYIKRGQPIRFKGGAGSEVYTVSIIPD